MCAIKENLRQIIEITEKWRTMPLMKRKTTVTYSPTEFDEAHRPYLSSRYADVVDGGKAIHRLLLESNKELKVSKGAPAWKAYVEYVNELVVDGLARLVGESLTFLSQQIDADAVLKAELAPLLEVQIELAPPEVLFSPRLAIDPLADAARKPDAMQGEAPPAPAAKAVGAMVAGWLKDFFGACKLVKRLDRAEGDFLNEVNEREVRRDTGSVVPGGEDTPNPMPTATRPVPLP